MTELDDAVELAPYHDEPAQLPSGAPGKRGVLRLGFERRDGRTVLADLYRRAPLLVQQALYWDEAMPDLACVFLVTTSGGLLQGDRHTIRVRLAEHTQAHLTTQSATKIQRMDANYAAQTQDIVLEDGAYLEYLPDPVIPYRNSRFISRTRVSLPESATALYAETILPGRKYHHDTELFGYDLFSSTLRATRPDGRELFVEKFVIEPGRFPVDRCAVMGGFHVLANVVLLTSPDRADRVIERVPVTFAVEDPVVAGVSRLPNGAGLIYKVLGADSEPVGAAVRDFWALVRREIVGVPLTPPFAWR
ncbi:urease accessory protein UreD [Dactylosporangium roseum]|uniref:Urease accessory protein UreD n=1 Tax=Dactylosporangium roseum TaxID=47989 RepID=A0ABY5YWV2_9ACTN|nr:urease accessory protein UreD [Dactylosporangium roseum]UWZ34236.1 urease accessory protein UreD [Dactylosporangium roseum]